MFSVTVAYLFLVLGVRFFCCPRKFVVAKNKLLQWKSYCCMQLEALGHRMIQRFYHMDKTRRAVRGTLRPGLWQRTVAISGSFVCFGWQY